MRRPKSTSSINMRALSCMGSAIIALLILASASQAQNLIVPISDRLPPAVEARAAQADDEAAAKPDFEIAYGLNYRLASRSNRSGAKILRGPLALRYFTGRFFFEISANTFRSRYPSTGPRVTGFGDTSVTGIVTAVTQAEGRPGVSFLYTLKIPTGSASKGLGSGRADHTVLGLIEKNVNPRTKLGANVGGLFVGKSGESGFNSIGLLTLSFQRDFGPTVPELGGPRFRFYTEVNNATRGTADTPSEIYNISRVRIRLTPRTSFTAGTQAGITSNSPRFGVFSSLSVTGNLGEFLGTR